jgi:cystathionine beta-lyase
MSRYDFDQLIDRHDTCAVKIDAMEQRFGRADLTSMWIADMDFAVCPEIVESLKQRIDHPIYGYAVASDSYWQSIINWLDHRHNFKVSREEITYIPGVVKGIALVVNFFTQPGDKIVIQPPVYHPFKNVVEGNDRIVVNNPLILTENYRYEMDFDHLEKIFVEEKPKMMILCNPHNPGGIRWDNASLLRLASLCKAHNVLVISDEIHADLVLYGKRHHQFASISQDASDICITLGAPSKTFNIPGLVSSWVIIKNQQLREPFFKWLSVNEFDATTFTATIATEAAYTLGEQWLDEALEYIEGNIDFLIDYCATNIPQIKPVRPQASFLIWLDCRELGLDQEQLVDLFVNKARLALNDGKMFGAEGEGFMRMNIACPRSVLNNALASLAHAVKSLAQ